METDYNFTFTKHVGVEMLKKLVVLVIVFFVIVSCVGQKDKNTNASKQKVSENSQPQSELVKAQEDAEIGDNLQLEKYTLVSKINIGESGLLPLLDAQGKNEFNVRELSDYNSKFYDKYESEPNSFKKKEILQAESESLKSASESLPKYIAVPFISRGDNFVDLSGGKAKVLLGLSNQSRGEYNENTSSFWLSSDVYLGAVGGIRIVRPLCYRLQSPLEHLQVNDLNTAQKIEELRVQDRLVMVGVLGVHLDSKTKDAYPIHVVYGLFDADDKKSEKLQNPIFAAHYKLNYDDKKNWKSCEKIELIDDADKLLAI